MNSINDLQQKILVKIENINVNNYYYFNPVNYSIGYGLLKFFKKKKDFFFIIKIFFKELIKVFLINDYELIKNHNNKLFKKVIFTWGDQSNINKNTYQDKYFRKKSSDDLDILWVVLYRGNYDKKTFSNFENVYFIVEKKKDFLSKILSFIKFFFNSIKIKNKSFLNFLFYMTWHNIFRIKLKKIYENILHEKIDYLMIPYEGQPFQSELINQVKKISKNVTVLGFIHSYPSFPTHLLKKQSYPDKLLLSSEDQLKFFSKRISFENKLKLIESLRFTKKDKTSMLNKIYLPIDFYSKKKIINSLEFLISKISKNYNFSFFEVCNHPVSKHSIKHIKLMQKIKSLIKKTKPNQNQNQFSIFIGSTGAVLEALELGVKVFHITEDPVLEVYSDFCWDNIEMNQLSENIFSYNLKEKNKSIIFGSEKSKFHECFED